MNSFLNGFYTTLGALFPLVIGFVLVIGGTITIVLFRESAHYSVMCTIKNMKKQGAKIPIEDLQRISLWLYFSPKKIRKFDSNLKMGMSIKGAYESTIRHFTKEQ